MNFETFGGFKRNKNKTKKNKKGGALMTIGEAKKILEIDETITNEEEIEQLATKKYRKLARQYHPDKNAAPSAVEYFKKINEAYSLIIGKIQIEETTETEMNKENIKDSNDITELLSIASNLSMNNAFLVMEDSVFEPFIHKILKVFLSDEYQNKFKKIGFKTLFIELLTTTSEDYIELNTQTIMNIKDLSYTEIINIINSDNGNSEYLIEYYYSENIKLYNKIINPNKSTGEISSSIPVDSEENLQEIPETSNPVDSEEKLEEIPATSKPDDSEEKLEEISATSNSDSYPDNYDGSFHEPQESEYSSVKDWFTGKRNEKWMNSGGGDGFEDFEILDDININKFIYEINKLSDKPKNLDTINKINTLIGEITSDDKEKIMKNMDKIKKITSDIKNSTLDLTLKIDNIIKSLEIENQNLGIENQKGGVFPLLAAVAAPTVTLTKINFFLKAFGTSCSDIPILLANSPLAKKVGIDAANVYVQQISSLIKVVENPLTFGWEVLVEKIGYAVILEYVMKVKDGLWYVVDSLKGIPGVFLNFIISICTCLYSHWMITISVLGLIIFINSTYYKRGVQIWKLDRKSWMSSIYIYWCKKIRLIKRQFTLYKSNPDELELFLAAKQNNWERKQYKLGVQLDNKNAFDEINFELFCNMAKTYTSTITVNMKQINTIKTIITAIIMH
jgi:hypothetical protein